MKFAHTIADEVRHGHTSAYDVISDTLVRAEQAQQDLNCFITIAAERALTQAAKLDAQRKNGDSLGPLAGVPIVIKDNICTEGLCTTAASRSLAEFVPPYNATVVTRLEHAGAIIIAKSNLDEFGMGGSTENTFYGPARNPWDTSRTPGGSSGGSAAAVAAGVVPLALGTDTGGSVRQPGAFNGIIGFKPTYGRLSRYGVIAYASSLDQVGVLARSSRDIATAMDIMGGHDDHDATSIAGHPPAFTEVLGGRSSLEGLRIGVVKELCGVGNTSGIQAALTRSKAELTALGAELVDVSLPHAKYGVAAYYLVAPAEASSNLARYDGMVYSSRQGENSLGQAEAMMRSRGAGFGAEVRRRILIGTYALSAGYYDAYYGKALKVRRLIADDFASAFAHCDLLLTPTTPSSAYKLGEKSSDPLAMYLDDLDTCLANLAGIGAVNIPAGLADNDMPCGMQLLAPALHDELLIEVTAVLEAAKAEAFAPLAPASNPA